MGRPTHRLLLEDTFIRLLIDWAITLSWARIITYQNQPVMIIVIITVIGTIYGIIIVITITSVAVITTTGIFIHQYRHPQRLLPGWPLSSIRQHDTLVRRVGWGFSTHVTLGVPFLTRGVIEFYIGVACLASYGVNWRSSNPLPTN